MGHYLVSGRSSAWETAAGLGAVTILQQKPEKDGISFVFYIKSGEKILQVTPEMVSILVQQ